MMLRAIAVLLVLAALAGCKSSGEKSDVPQDPFEQSLNVEERELYWHQRGTDAALAPWQDAPQWLFYEATPGDDLNKELQLALEVYNFDTDNAVTGDAPGYYNEDNIAAYNDARDIAEGLDETATEQEIRKAINDLRDAFAAVDEVNPIVEGWYSIVSAGKGPGYYSGDAPSTVIDEEDMFALYNESGSTMMTATPASTTTLSRTTMATGS